MKSSIRCPSEKCGKLIGYILNSKPAFYCKKCKKIYILENSKIENKLIKLKEIPKTTIALNQYLEIIEKDDENGDI